MLHSLFYLETDLYVSGGIGWYHHPSSGAQTTVTTASGICYSVIATCRYRGRVETGSTSSTIAAGSSNGMTWYHHPSSGAQTTVTTASGICRSVIATCRYRGRVGTGSNSSTIAAGSSNGMTYHHPSSGAQTTVTTASGICRSVIAACRYRGRVGTGSNSSTIAAGSSNGMTWYHHPSSEAQATVTTASGICLSVIATCRYRGTVGTGSNSCTIAAGSSNGTTNTRCCSYSCLRFWWWVEVPPETCRAVSRYK